MTYRVVLAAWADAYLRRLEPALQRRIVARLESLAVDSLGPFGKRLRGRSGLQATRVGAWRILFTIDDRQQVISVDRIAPRGQVYRRR